MSDKRLQLIPYAERPDLLASTVKKFLSRREVVRFTADIFVVEIDPTEKDGDVFCKTYGVDRNNGANCVILEAQRAGQLWYVAALVPVGLKMDIGGELRRYVGARRLSVAPLDKVLSLTEMEYGSITALGLPEDWNVLVDARIVEKEYVFLGSGRQQSKMRVPGGIFRTNGLFRIVEGLGKSFEKK